MLSATSMLPRPGKAPAGGATGKGAGPTRRKVAAQVSTGTAGTTCSSTCTLSVERPSEVRAETVQRRVSTLSGAVSRQVTGTAPPAGIVTVCGPPGAGPGSSSALAVTVIGLSVPFLSVKVAPYSSPERTRGADPDRL